ncbi:MAG: hypothetical protein QXH92_04195 [Candidatus Aenigmatarchaeota archaeon]
MLKVIPIYQEDWNEPICSIVPVSSRGLRGGDLNRFSKKAGYDLAYKVSQLTFENGEVPIHLIALGAGEYYGPNRNGDWFGVDVCRKYHKTYEKFARFYRNHQNKDPSKSYGIIKLSHYNEDMHRIELIVSLFGNEKIAKKHGGLVADRELEKLAAGAPIAVSMACHVSHDICSICGNKARSRSEYCLGIDEGGTCEGGGLRHKIASTLADGRILYAINPDPKFIDISHVPKPADRIAWVTSELFLSKEASYKSNISGAELAEYYGLDVPVHFQFLDYEYELRSLLTKCATVENNVWNNLDESEVLLHMYRIDNLPQKIYDFTKTNGIEWSVNNGLLVPMRVFSKWAGLINQYNNAVSILPHIYNRLQNQSKNQVIEKTANYLQKYSFKNNNVCYNQNYDESKIRMKLAALFNRYNDKIEKWKRSLIKTAIININDLLKDYISYQLIWLKNNNNVQSTNSDVIKEAIYTNIAEHILHSTIGA